MADHTTDNSKSGGSPATVTLAYGASERVSKPTVQGGVTTQQQYVYGMSGWPIIEKTYVGAGAPSQQVYVYGPTGLIAFHNDQGERFFVLKDHLGSARVVADTGGAAAAWYNYMPHGAMMASAVSQDVAYRYTGQEYDGESGLHNYRARLYDAELGRFYAMDPAGQFASPYLYAANNPIRYIDPTGMFFDSYYSNKTGKYLGDDGAATNDARLIAPDVYAQNQSNATVLQANSQVIKFEENKIQNDVQAVADQSATTPNEHSTNIILNVASATVTSIPGGTGDNSHSRIYSVPWEKVSQIAYDEKGQSLGYIALLLAHVHGHPTTDELGRHNAPGPSTEDQVAAKLKGITIFSIDAYGRERSGNPMRIGQVTPDGKITRFVGVTAGNGPAPASGILEFGKTALEITGGKRP